MPPDEFLLLTLVLSNVFWYSTEKHFYLLNPFDIFTEMHLRTSAAAVCCQDQGQ